VEVDAANGAVVLVEAVYQGTHAVVPQLDHPRVQRGEDPWALGVERQPLDPVRLGLRTGAQYRYGRWEAGVSVRPELKGALE
jgi:hypothetical protein